MKKLLAILCAAILITATAGRVSAVFVVADLVQITYEPVTVTDGSESNEAYRRLGNTTSIGFTDTFDLNGTFVQPYIPIRLSP